jgi:hypothetical protein
MQTDGEPGSLNKLQHGNWADVLNPHGSESHMTKLKKDAEFEDNPYMLKIEQVLELHKLMSADGRAELAAWEAKHLNHNGARTLGMSDWPGWIKR